MLNQEDLDRYAELDLLIGSLTKERESLEKTFAYHVGRVINVIYRYFGLNFIRTNGFHIIGDCINYKAEHSNIFVPYKLLYLCGFSEAFPKRFLIMSNDDIRIELDEIKNKVCEIKVEDVLDKLSAEDLLVLKAHLGVL